MKPVFFGFIGFSGVGKTTLIEKLIKVFTGKGYRVGAVKHDAHKFEIDYPGKDSYRMKHAGAWRVVLSSKDKLAMVEDREKEKSLDEIKEMFDDCDFVFVEGCKLGDLPKIEVHRDEVGEGWYIKKGVKDIVLVVSDKRYDLPVPVFLFDEIDRIVDFIESFKEHEDT